MIYNKSLKTILLCVLVCVSFLVLSGCAYNPYETSNSRKTEKLFKVDVTQNNKGKHVTSNGELRTLIVYVMFSDDDKKSNKSWEYSTSQLPGWSHDMINKTTELYFPKDNLTKYFYEMSAGKFMLYGDIYPKVIIPKNVQKKYKSISEVNYEVLKTIDNEIDFSKYDNWTRTKEGENINSPDGKVDAIFIVYRNFENRLFFGNGWTGSAHFYLSQNIETNDGVSIKAGRLDLGSGVQTRGAKNGFTFMKYILAHEFGHLLFGAGHIENITNLALMTGGPVWNASRGMHSWEKNKLGWLDYIDIPVYKNSSQNLEDYLTENKSYRIKLSDNEWIVLENHQKISSNDWAQDKGVYIYHVNNANKFAPRIKVECADGNWNFEVNKDEKRLIRTTPNLSGKTEMDYRKSINRKLYACYNEVYGDNSAWGDKYDAFDLTYNNIYSPSSNPSSLNKAKVKFAIEVTDTKEGNYTINTYFNDIYNKTPPSKPQLLEVEKLGGKYKLKWLQNSEPDLSGYNIYQYDKNKKEFKKLNYLKTSAKDKIVEYDVTSLTNRINNRTIITITALDNSNKESVNSNYAEIFYDKNKSSWTWKRLEEL